MSALAAGAIIGGVGALAKTGMGIYQQRKGTRMLEEQEDPQYQASEFIKRNLATAERFEDEGIASEVKSDFMRSVDRSVAGAQEQTQSLGGGTRGVGAIVQSGVDAYSDLLSQDALARERNRAIAMSARERMADEERTEFQINELDPFERDRNYALGLQGAGMQNIAGGIDMAGQIGMNIAQSAE